MKQPINNPDSPLMRAHAVRVEFQPMPSCGMESPLSQSEQRSDLGCNGRSAPRSDPSDWEERPGLAPWSRRSLRPTSRAQGSCLRALPPKRLAAHPQSVPMATLIGLSYSPWTRKARWALDHHGLSYTFVEHLPMLGEPLLRWKLRRWRAPVTVPAFIDKGARLMDSCTIARPRRTPSPPDNKKLFPHTHRDAIDGWNRAPNASCAPGEGLSSPPCSAPKKPFSLLLLPRSPNQSACAPHRAPWSPWA